MDSLEQKMNEFFVNHLPGMSVNMKEKAARLYPWIMMIFGVLGLSAWLSSIRFFFGFAGLLPQVYSLPLLLAYRIHFPLAIF